MRKIVIIRGDTRSLQLVIFGQWAKTARSDCYTRLHSRHIALLADIQKFMIQECAHFAAPLSLVVSNVICGREIWQTASDRRAATFAHYVAVAWWLRWRDVCSRLLFKRRWLGVKRRCLERKTTKCGWYRRMRAL